MAARYKGAASRVPLFEPAAFSFPDCAGHGSVSAGLCGTPARGCRSLCPVRQPAQSCHLSWRRGGRFLTCHKGAIMADSRLLPSIPARASSPLYRSAIGCNPPSTPFVRSPQDQLSCSGLTRGPTRCLGRFWTASDRFGGHVCDSIQPACHWSLAAQALKRASGRLSTPLAHRHGIRFLEPFGTAFRPSWAYSYHLPTGVKHGFGGKTKKGGQPTAL